MGFIKHENTCTFLIMKLLLGKQSRDVHSTALVGEWARLDFYGLIVFRHTKFFTPYNIKCM